jgi:hypothetical protein
VDPFDHLTIRYWVRFTVSLVGLYISSALLFLEPSTYSEKKISEHLGMFWPIRFDIFHKQTAITTLNLHCIILQMSLRKNKIISNSAEFANHNAIII